MQVENPTKSKLPNKYGGSILIYNVVIIFIFSLVMIGALSYASMQLKITASTITRQQAFQVAEAGVNYYQWHLAHFPEDFWDGNATSTPGPYVHDFIDTDTGQKIGEYSLEITPPATGSTVTLIKSVGYTLDNPQNKRTIIAQYGVPSLAKYAFLTNSDVWIGSSESVNGEMHANGGIRFDGSGNAPIGSAKQTYICQTYHGCSPTTKPGIWGSASAATKAFWQFPMPNVDFTTMTRDLAVMKSEAQLDGIYLPPSNAYGYSIVFVSDGTLRIYRVDSLRSHQTGWDVNDVAHNEDLDYNTRTELAVCSPSPCAVPANGQIYVEDRLWVEGTLKGKAMVAAAQLPYNAPTAPSIIIPNNLLYEAKDGSNVLGLIGQQDILISYYSPNNLEIDAAMIAQNGSAQHYYWPWVVKNQITIYGAMSSYGVWTWSWVSGSTTVSGYKYTVTTYDSNLLFGPPPGFPMAPDGYRQMSWTSD